jgi:hypothetical protein
VTPEQLAWARGEVFPDPELPERLYPPTTQKENAAAARKARRAEWQRIRRAAIKADVQAKPKAGLALPAPLLGFYLSDGRTLKGDRLGDLPDWTLLSPKGRVLRPENHHGQIRWRLRVNRRLEWWALNRIRLLIHPVLS